MGKVSKALAKFEVRGDGDQTGKSINDKELLRDLDQESREKKVPQLKRTARSLVCMFLAGFVLLGFFLRPDAEGILVVPPSINVIDDQPADPLIKMTEKVEVVQTLPTMPRPEPPCPQAEEAGEQGQLPVKDGRGSEVVVAPSVSVSQALSVKEEVNIFLQGWKQAWQQSVGPGGNPGKYYSFYANGFSDGILDKAAWQRDKARKNGCKTWIKVELKEVSIVEQSDVNIHLRFFQQYRSSNYTDNSNKTLILIREAGQLKILSERG